MIPPPWTPKKVLEYQQWLQGDDPIEEDFKAGRLGEYGEFEGWPEEAYANHPRYQMARSSHPLLSFDHVTRTYTVEDMGQYL